MEPLRVMVLVTALPLNELYNCVKFKVDSINSFRDMLPTKFVTDGRQRSDPYMSRLLCTRRHKNAYKRAIMALNR